MRRPSWIATIPPAFVTVFVSPNNPVASELIKSIIFLLIIPYEITLGIWFLPKGGRLPGD
jgi:hypothetical protein